MEARTKQTKAYEWMLELMAVRLSQRNRIMRGAELFLQRGWPSNHFTVGMAARAGMGLVPPVYQGLGSEGHYFDLLKTSSGS